jgi:nucleoside-diphosphate-sugar epimerase
MSDEVNPVNIGNPTEMSVFEFAQEVLRITGSRGKIVFKPLPQDDPKVRQPDITKIKQLLNWEPKVSLEDGLKETMLYFKEKLNY